MRCNKGIRSGLAAPPLTPILLASLTSDAFVDTIMTASSAAVKPAVRMIPIATINLIASFCLL